MEHQPLLREVENYIGMQVRNGFYSREEILQDCVDDFLYDEQYKHWLTEDVIRKMVDQAIRQQLHAQQNWPRVTDCDRLDAAFTALERDGIAARHDYACCQSCGHTELRGECDQMPDKQGYVFYHDQDTEMSLSGYGLMLSYGAMGSDERDHLNIGQRIVFALQDAGLQVAWSGNPYERIYIRHFNWQRRFPMREAA